MSLIYKVPSYQTSYDALISIEVPLDNIVDILKDSGYDLDTDFSITKGELIYEQTYIVKPKGGQVSVPEVPTTSTYITNSAQNLFDICLMTVGDLNKIIQLTRDNQFDNINDYPDGVIGVTYSNADVTDSGFKLALKKANINITTGIVYEPSQNGYLLQEDLFRILQEDGYRIILT